MAYWVTKIDGSSSEIAYGVSTDAAGDVYVTGRYTSNPVFLYNVDGSTATSLSNLAVATNAVFVAKYNGKTGAVMWATHIDGLGDDFNEDVAIAVSSVSGHEGVYVTGTCRSNPIYVYNAGGLMTLSLSMLGTSGIFLAKFDPTTGDAVWGARVDSSSTTNVDKGGGVDVDSAGDVVVTGTSHAGTVYVYDSEGNGISNFTVSNYGCFIVKYNSQGAVQWVTRADSGQEDDSYAIAIDSETNDVYITGAYYASLSFYNPSNLTSSVYTLVNPLSSNAGAFVAKYSPTGTFTWATRMDGVTAGAGERGYGIAVSNSGVYVTGRFDNNHLVIYNVDGSSLVSSLSNNGSHATFLVKYSKDGVGQWGVRLDGINSDYGLAVAVDSMENVYTTGTYGNQIGVIYVYDTQGNAVMSFENTTASRSIFLMKHTSSGDLVWLASGVGSTCQGYEVAIDSLRSAVYMVGRGISQTTFRDKNETDVYTLKASGEYGFVTRYTFGGYLYKIHVFDVTIVPHTQSKLKVFGIPSGLVGL